MRPVEHLGAEFHDRRIQAQEFVLKAKFLLGRELLDLFQQAIEKLLERLPRAVRVGIAER